MKLRSHLLLLVVAIAAPLLIFAALVVYLFGDREDRAVERGLRDTARAYALAIDREIAASIATLRALAASEHLAAREFDTFYAEAARVRAVHEAWPTVFLADRMGQEIFTLLAPLGTPLPNIQDDPDFAVTIATGQPHVSNLLIGPVSRMPVVRVHVPIILDGTVMYDVVATLPSRHIAELLTQRRNTPPLVALVLDREGTIVARTGEDGAGWIGLPAPAGFLERTRVAPGGFFVSTALGRGTHYVAFNRVPRADFVVAVGVPASAAGRAWFWLVAGASALALVGAVGFALVMADRISGPILGLAARARAVGRGEPQPASPPSAVDEVQVVRDALDEAAVLAQERAREHEQRVAADAARREAEAAATTLAALANITEAALRHLALDDLFRDLLARLRRSLKADTATILLLAEDDTSMNVVASEGLHEEVEDRVRVPVGSGVAGRIAASDGGLVIEDLSEVDVVSPALRTHVTSVVGAALKVDGRVIGVVHLGSRARRRFTQADLAFVRVVADRVALAVDRAQVHEAERRARGEAEAANRAKDEFLAMLGHELRNPLGTIANATHVLARMGEDEGHAAQARRVISRQVRHLARLVDDLLDVSRVIVGKITLDRRRLDLAIAVRHAVEAFRGAGRTAEHHLDMDVRSVWVDADEVRVEQVVGNLLTNALKYTPRGRAIRVTVGLEGDSAVLTVADSGIGITADLLPRIFDLFVQGDQGLERRHGGLGVGLTLVRRLVELHGGTVEASSPGPDAGSTFTVRLPRVAPGSRRPAAGSDGADVARRRVLVVEDNRDARQMLRELLELEGHEVFEADDGRLGLDLALRTAVDIALIDLGLPGIDGYEMARAVRRTGAGQAMVLVALTGYGQSEDRRRAAEAGFDEYLVKPVDPERLISVLGTVRTAGQA